jgi:electron transport complex protein RnfB
MVATVLVVVIMLLIALLAGFIYSSFTVSAKPTLLEALEQLMPGDNCRLCGYVGCREYVSAISRAKEERMTLCRLQTSLEQERLVRALARVNLLPKAYIQKSERMAYVFCGGDKTNSEYRFAYKGLPTCQAMHETVLTDRQCHYGCLGLGDCVPVCPEKAIVISKGVARIEKELCTGCGICVESCPAGSIGLIPRDADYVIACRSASGYEETQQACRVGCTGCGVCVKRAPFDGFTINNNLCSIDYTNSGEERWRAAVKCEPHCIVPISKKERERYAANLKTEKGV